MDRRIIYMHFRAVLLFFENRCPIAILFPHGSSKLQPLDMLVFEILKAQFLQLNIAFLRLTAEGSQSMT